MDFVSIGRDFDYVIVVASLNASFPLWSMASSSSFLSPEEEVESSPVESKSIAAVGAGVDAGDVVRCYSDRIQRLLLPAKPMGCNRRPLVDDTLEADGPNETFAVAVVVGDGIVADEDEKVEEEEILPLSGR